MFSFVGWEAVSHLAGELRDPGRQLPRAIFTALAIVTVLYLGLAAATVGVLGTAAPSDVPLADLMAAGLGTPGRTVTAFLAVLLTMGAMNAYIGASAKLAGALAGEGAAPAFLAKPERALGLLAVIATVELVPLMADALTVHGLVRATSACFVAVYVVATAAGVRLLDGPARWCAAVSFIAVTVVFAFSGAYVAVPLAAGALALFRARRVAPTSPRPACTGVAVHIRS
jgi:amino acid efflux transporter